MSDEPSRVLLVAACALIDPDGRILIAERPAGKAMAGLWEFPGGKVEPDETPEQAVVRELREELGVEPCESCLEPFAFASEALTDGRHLVMPLFLCRRWDGFVDPKENQQIAWLRPDRLSSRPLVPADKPLAAALRDRVGQLGVRI